MRYVYLVFLCICFQLYSFSAFASGKLKLDRKQIAYAEGKACSADSNTFNDDFQALPQVVKKYKAQINLFPEHSSLHNALPVSNTECKSAFIFSHYLIIFSFLYPKHVFW
ncbi:hypothetical protein DBR11_02630 [Pedobacter sp. HMWF019]|nr:hypothetical protein DBR11_02630 [Pedobacter sp. HMWF019]